MRASSPTTDPVDPVEPAPSVGPTGAEPGRGGPRGTLEVPSAWLHPDATHPIAEVAYRRRAQVGGRIRSVRIRPWGEVPTLEAVVADETAAITVAFLGRRSLAGVDPGSHITVEGMVGQHDGKLVILNPAYDLQVPDPSGA